MDKFSYAIGLGIGQNLLSMGAKGIDVDDFAQAIKDVLEQTIHTMKWNTDSVQFDFDPMNNY